MFHHYLLFGFLVFIAIAGVWTEKQYQDVLVAMLLITIFSVAVMKILNRGIGERRLSSKQLFFVSYEVLLIFMISLTPFYVSNTGYSKPTNLGTTFLLGSITVAVFITAWHRNVPIIPTAYSKEK